MSRPSTEAEYLAKLVPPSVAATGIGRRSLLRGALAGAGFLGASGLLAACGSSGSSSLRRRAAAAPQAATGTLTFGSNQSDAVPKKAYADSSSTLQRPPTSRSTVKVNTVDHNTFQENINNYLQGKPDDVFTWFAGYRMRFFAAQGLVGDISDVWQNLNGMPDALQDGLHRRRRQAVLRAARQLPVGGLLPQERLRRRRLPGRRRRWTSSSTLSKQMQKDGLVPIAFADKDGWPAMGTFDQLNMRINGYQFHVDLMAGKKAWDSDRGQEGLRHLEGAAALPPGRLARPHLAGGRAVAAAEEVRDVPARHVRRPAVPKDADQDDLDFFTFPEIDSTIGADAIDAPIDGFMMAAKPEERGGGQGVPRLPRHARRRRTSTSRPTRRSSPSNTRRRHARLHARCRRRRSSSSARRQEHLAVPRPRHPPRLRLDGDDPGAADVHQEPERHRRAHQEHREPEEVDLRVAERRPR